MKVAIVIAALAVMLGTASAGDYGLTTCFNNLPGLAGAIDCLGCAATYSSFFLTPEYPTSARQKCYDCLVNHRETGNKEDCYSAIDDGFLNTDVYAPCRYKSSSDATTSLNTCFDCLTNFKLKPDSVMDLCKMVEPLVSNKALETPMFNCLANTGGASTAGFTKGSKTYAELRTSPCFACSASPVGTDCLNCITNLQGDSTGQANCATCTTQNCIYCLSNFRGNAAGQAKCKSCQGSTNFWSCVYSK